MSLDSGQLGGAMRVVKGAQCPITRCPASSVAGPGSAPAVFCTSGSMWTDSCSPLTASCAPAPDGTCSAGPSRLGPVQR